MFGEKSKILYIILTEMRNSLRWTTFLVVKVVTGTAAFKII